MTVRFLLHLALMMWPYGIASAQPGTSNPRFVFSSITTKATDSVIVGEYRTITWNDNGRRMIQVIHTSTKSTFNIDNVPEDAPIGELEWRLANGVPFAVIAEVSRWSKFPRSKKEVLREVMGHLLVVRGLTFRPSIDTAIDATHSEARIIARHLAESMYLIPPYTGKK